MVYQSPCCIDAYQQGSVQSNIWFGRRDRFDEIQNTVKPVLKQPLSKRPLVSFQDPLSLNAGQKYCRMLQVEHSAILSTCIKLPFALSIFEWPFYKGFTVAAMTAILDIGINRF